MTDHLAGFASLAAAAIADIATGTLVDALASLEHALPSLRREQRYAGQAVARALHRLARGERSGPAPDDPPREALDEVMHWCRVAAHWGSREQSRANDVELGSNIERALTVAATLPGWELRELLRVVVGELRRQMLAEARHVAA